MADEQLKKFGAAELEKIGILIAEDVLDSDVVRVPKTYPAYFGSYDRFNELRAFTDGFENLFLIGRNGMHKYNNQDHSMLTAMQAVENVVQGKTSKENIWSINTEQDYHEKGRE
jgi:protoporphyrinogen oxidase